MIEWTEWLATLPRTERASILRAERLWVRGRRTWREELEAGPFGESMTGFAERAAGSPKIPVPTLLTMGV